MRIAICEDRLDDMENLKEMVMYYCDNNQMDAHIDCFYKGEDLLEKFQKNYYHIIFLDVLMEGLSGMETAKKIRKVDDETALIFITISPEFAADSYLLNAAFYIVKPLEKEKLALAMSRCQNLIWQHAKAIEVIQSKRAVKIRLHDIIYIDSQRNDCIIHTEKDEIRTRISLSELEIKLNSPQFLRCHQSFIINLEWIRDMQRKGFILHDGTVIPISKAYLNLCKERFNKYIIRKSLEV